jgi:hypothetical protein
MSPRLLVLSLLVPVFTHAQFLAPDTPLQQAFIEATQQDKLIFLMTESGECQQCNDVADKALQDKALQQELKKNFIAIRISPFHPDLNYIKEKYNYTAGNTVLFLDKFGTLVHRMNISTSNYNTYLQAATQATVKKTEADHIRTLELDAFTGKLDLNRLYTLLETRKRLSLPTDALLNQYVKQLPADSLTTVTTLERIARMSPVLGSSADTVLRKNRDLFNQVWATLPLNERVAINKQIIFKSRQQAIAEKQLTKAVQVASFARSTYSEKTAGEKAYHYNLMEYFQGLHDTTAFLGAAVNYYDHFLMHVNAAGIKKLDSIRKANFVKQSPKDTIERTANRMVVRTTTTFSPAAQHYGEELHYAARSFYRMTKDNFYLKKALQWAAYANEFYESAYALDIWARLLYKVDNNAEQAIQLEEKAVTLLKTRGYSTEAHTLVLNKMKQGLAAD